MRNDSLPPDFQRRVALVDEKISEADVLESERQIDAALTAYKACFGVALRENVPIFIHQLVHIWIGVGFCYTDRHQWEQALQMYKLAEAALKSHAVIRLNPQSPSEQAKAQARDWAKFLPHGIHVAAPVGYDPVPELANLYESMALTYENSDRLPQAQACYQQAVEWHMRLKDPVGIARVWYYMAAGSQRREDWENLRIAAENMLALAERRQDVGAQIAAWQYLAQVSWNQLRMLDAIEYLKLAIETGRQTQHSDLERDEKILADFMRSFADLLQKRVAEAQPGRVEPLVDLARFKPLSELFMKVSLRRGSLRGVPQLFFVVHTSNLDEALQVLNLFYLAPLPVNVQTMRQLAGSSSEAFPNDVDLWIEWCPADIAPGQVIGRTVIPLEMHDDLLELNAQGMQFAVVLEEEKKGLFGKPRRVIAPVRYEPYLLDWYGIEGVAVYVRSNWREVTRENLEMLLDLLDRRIDERGLATGLLTQKGFVYRIAGMWDQAAECYLQEIRAGLRSDGCPGLGALTALCNLGTVYKKQRDFERARLSYRLALHLNPNYFEPLVSLAGILEGFDQQLLCLSRAYRVRPDDPFVMTAMKNLCGEHPHAVEEVAWLVRETSQAIDLAKPMGNLVVEDPAKAVWDLLSALPGDTQADDLRAGEVAGSLSSLEDVTQVLERFAVTHIDSGLRLSTVPRWCISIEEMAEFAKDMLGQLSVTQSSGAVLQLAYQPDLVIRVTLHGSSCTARIMQEVKLPDVDEVTLKSLVSETVPAQAEVLYALLAGWAAEGILYQSGGGWQCRG